VTGSGPLSGRAARLAAVLEDWPRLTVRLEEVWTAFDQADPASATSADRRQLLADTLAELEAHAVLSRAQTTDTTARPPLPTQVRLPRLPPKETADLLKRSVAWRPELEWVHSARLTVAQVERLRQVNVWLRDRVDDHDVEPVRERSLEIFGHEKVLDGLVRTGVFAPSRLTLTLLRTVRTHPPLPVVRIGSGTALLVVENDNTFHTLREHLRRQSGPVGWIAWGAGGAFEASVRTIGDLTDVKVTYYFGDIDADGLRIPRNAAETAARENLPEVLPATRLYHALLETTVRQSGQPTLELDTAASLATWLGEGDLAQSVQEILVTGQRIPQEALNVRAVASLGPEIA
jgi:hypothetical protein